MIKEKIKYFNNLRKSKLGLRFQRGVFWNTVGIFISRFLLVIASIIVARILGKETYGELGIIQSTTAMFGVFAGLGLGITSTKYLAEFKYTDPQKAGRIISLTNLIALIGSSIISIILILFAPVIADRILAAPSLTPYLRISAVLLFFSTLNGVQVGILTGLEKFKEISKINTLNGLLNFILLITGTYFLLLMGAVWALSISILVTFVLSQMLVRKELKKFGIKLNYSDCWIENKVIWYFSIPAFFSGALVGPVNWICNAILVNQKNGYAEMGVYNAANQWFSILLFIPGIISTTILPILTEKISMKDSKSSKKIIQYSIIINGIIILPIIIPGLFLSNSIMMLYGNQFANHGAVLAITLITSLIYALQLPVGNMIAATGRMWIGFIINLFWGIIFIVFVFIIDIEGAINLAYARLIAYIFMFFISFILINKFIRR